MLPFIEYTVEITVNNNSMAKKDPNHWYYENDWCRPFMYPICSRRFRRVKLGWDQCTLMTPMSVPLQYQQYLLRHTIRAVPTRRCNLWQNTDGMFQDGTYSG